MKFIVIVDIHLLWEEILAYIFQIIAMETPIVT
jgi:hypothetical protein